MKLKRSHDTHLQRCYSDRTANIVCIMSEMICNGSNGIWWLAMDASYHAKRPHHLILHIILQIWPGPIRSLCSAENSIHSNEETIRSGNKSRVYMPVAHEFTWQSYWNRGDVANARTIECERVQNQHSPSRTRHKTRLQSRWWGFFWENGNGWYITYVLLNNFSFFG